MKHTPTPWVMNSTKKFIENPGGLAITNYNGSVLVGSVNHDLTDKSIEEYCANAERIVECVNAFEGIDHPKSYMDTVNEIMRKGGEAANEIDRLKEQRKTLLNDIELLREKLEAYSKRLTDTGEEYLKLTDENVQLKEQLAAAMREIQALQKITKTI